jgi:hypothetical protein
MSPSAIEETTTAINALPPVWARRLVGNPPRIFDGDRDESAAFLREFRIYQMLNKDTREMELPYYRVLLALGYIRGCKSRIWVGDWVDKQLTALTNKVTGEMSTVATDEQLWDDFVSAFERAFTSTTAKYDTMIQLRALEMEGQDLDTYMAVFEHLASKAGYDLNTTGASSMFLEGLPKGLKIDIVDRRDDIPSTYSE